MDPQTATLDQTSQIDKYITLLLNDLTALHAQKGLENLSLLSPTQIARLEIIDFEVDYYISLIGNKFPDQKKAFDAIFKNVTPKTVANLNYDQLGELIRFFESLTLLPKPISASLSAEDRARIVALYEQHLRLQDIEKEQNRLLGVWQEQIREYNRNIIDRLRNQYSRTGLVNNEGIVSITYYAVDRYIQTPPLDRGKLPTDAQGLYKEWLADITKYLERERKLREDIIRSNNISSTLTQTVRDYLTIDADPLLKRKAGSILNLPHETQIEQLRQVEETLELLHFSGREEPAADVIEYRKNLNLEGNRELLDGILRAVLNEVLLDARNNVAPTIEKREQYVAQSLTTGIFVSTQLAPHVTTNRFITTLAPIILDAQKTAQITEIGKAKELTPLQIQQEQRQIKQRIDTHTRIFGTISEQALRLMKQEAYKKIDQSNLDDDAKTRFKKQFDALTLEDIISSDKEKPQLNSAEEIATLLTQREITQLLTKIEPLSSQERAYLTLLVGNSFDIDAYLQGGQQQYKFGRVTEYTQRIKENATPIIRPRITTRREYKPVPPKSASTFDRFITGGLSVQGEIMRQWEQAQAAQQQPQVSSPIPPSKGIGGTANPFKLGQPILGPIASLTKKSLFAQPWFWVVLISAILFAAIYFNVIANDGAFLPGGSGGGKRGFGAGEGLALAAGTCPVPVPNVPILTQTLSHDPENGHGSENYWNIQESRGIDRYTIPDGGIYSGCSDSSCPYYGLAIDVRSANADQSVVVPYLCDNQTGCLPNSEGKYEMTWTVYRLRGSNAVYLESSDNGHYWKIVLIHLTMIDPNRRTYIARKPPGKSDLIGNYNASGGAPHIHFEVVEDEKPIDPTPFCTGKLFTEPIGGIQIPTGSGPYCALNDPVSQISSRFGAHANTFSCICNRESHGDNAAINDGCLPDGQRQHNQNQSLDYSVGIFQINLLYHPNKAFLEVIEGASLKLALEQAGKAGKTCMDAFDGARINCRIVDQTILNVCVRWFQDPNNNTLFAQNMSGAGFVDKPINLSPWDANDGSCF